MDLPCRQTPQTKLNVDAKPIYSTATQVNVGLRRHEITLGKRRHGSTAIFTIARKRVEAFMAAGASTAVGEPPRIGTRCFIIPSSHELRCHSAARACVPLVVHELIILLIVCMARMCRDMLTPVARHLHRFPRMTRNAHNAATCHGL